MKTLVTIICLTTCFLSESLFSQIVNPIPVNLVGSSDPIAADFYLHIFTPSPLGGTYHGGTYYGGTKEKWGYQISGLTPGLEYSLTCYYMMDVVQGSPAYNRTGDLSMSSGAPLDITTIAYIPEPNWLIWYSVDVTFTAVAATDRFDVEAESISDNSLWLFTDVSAAAIDPACDPLTTTASALEICLGEDITLTSVSDNGGAITWDGGVTNGVPYIPATAGTFTYHATSDFDGDCIDSVTVIVNPLPVVTASVDFATICLGDDVTFTGGGADTYVWDLGVTDGLPFTPAALGTVTYTVTGTDAATGCENTASVDVTVNDNPVVTATTTPDEVCIGETVTFTGGGADTYVWDGGVIDGTPFTPAAAGTFTFNVTGTMDSGCENTASVDITVHDLPFVTASVDPGEICEGESAVFTGGGADTYSWDLGVTDGAPFTPADAGTVTYTVTGTSALGCENTATVDLVVNAAPDVTASATEIEICLGESITFTGGGADTYVWDGGITDGLAFTPATAGTFTYTVTGTSAGGCSADAAIEVTVIECEEVLAVYSFENPCVGECITFTDNSIGTIVSWDWGFGGAADPNTSTEQNPTICLNTAGTFNIQLTITNTYGVTSSVVNSITVYSKPDLTAVHDTIINTGGIANLIAVTSSPGGVFSWTPDYETSCDDCQVTTASPQDSTMFTVTYIDENGCSAEANVMVLVNFVEGIGVPSAFTPNGDGNNDVLFVKGNGIESMKLVVYNRYGEVVFITTSQNIGWDGTYLNKEQNPGVFTWVLHYTFTTQKKGMMQGNTTLIR
ncbi:MAG: gliding motility-associated C-terminal domain-containing protein [Crocinitomix sp.]|nr:gliding motility-associated C-terminal domain-containing protein [Crocinitomix sp.]